MDWVTIIVALISSLAGGGLVRLFTLRESKTEKQLENKQKESDVYLKLINELQDQIERCNINLDKKDALIQEKADTIADLRMKLDSARSQLAVATMLRCRKISCLDRQPPISEAFTGNIEEQITNYVENMQ